MALLTLHLPNEHGVLRFEIEVLRFGEESIQNSLRLLLVPFLAQISRAFRKSQPEQTSHACERPAGIDGAAPLIGRKGLDNVECDGAKKTANGEP